MIPTQNIRITDTPQNIIPLADPDLTVGNSYVISNDNSNGDDVTVYIAKRTGANAPEPDDPSTMAGHPIRPGQDWGVTIEAGYNEYMWTLGGEVDVVISDWG